MTSLSKILSLATTGFLFSQLSYAQGNTSLNDQKAQLNTITTAVPFLTISPDARAGAMGDCGAATSPDLHFMHWNPAKLAFLDKPYGFAIDYTPWLRALVPDINLGYVTAYAKFGKKQDQGIGASLRYFSMGDITFTDNTGNNIGQYRPNEFAVDVNYARKLSKNFSGSIALRYINSNLTGGYSVGGTGSVGRAVAADLAFFYQSDKVKVGGKNAIITAGLNISNIGSKISYSNTKIQRDFLPQNMKLGGGIKFLLDDHNTFALYLDLNKLLVPTPPVYKVDSATGQILTDPNGNKIIEKGKDPNVGTISGIFQSFGDAPFGFKEELAEINICGGMEYAYNNTFMVRAGYFNESKWKGFRKYFTIGIGFKYSVFGLDFAYLIPATSGVRNPLENTLRFTLTFDFARPSAKTEVNE
jgi:hypothetical protein